MKKILLLAMAGLLTLGSIAYAGGTHPKGKKQPCTHCPQKPCTPDCKAHCPTPDCAKS